MDLVKPDQTDLVIGNSGIRADRSIAVFARNEQNTIFKCLTAIAAACQSSTFRVSILINGSTDRTLDVALSHPLVSKGSADIFVIEYGDKANAINRFIYDIRCDAQAYFFIDAYTEIGATALAALERPLALDPVLNASSGVPSIGRSARLLAQQMIRSSGLVGGLFALRRRFVDAFCERHLRLPIGLYRVDGLIGSMAMHDLDPVKNPWRTELVQVVPEATWNQRVLSLYRVRDILHQFNRMLRQARGRLENSAIKSVIYRSGYEGLPDSTDRMILDWLSSLSMPERLRWYRSPLVALAIYRTRRATVPLSSELVAKKVAPSVKSLT